jgi:hypothetical protein
MQRGRTLVVMPLAVALAGLTLLAYASPPDATHTTGIWDDGDYDDVVVLANSSPSVADTHRPCIPPLDQLVVMAVWPDDQLVDSRPFASRRSRAPPIA